MTVIFLLLAVVWTGIIMTLCGVLHTHHKRTQELEGIINRKKIEQGAGHSTTHGE